MIDTPNTPTNSQSNAYEFSVSELAQSLKQTVEERFGHVRVRGELGRVTIAKSGHVYLDIKDDRAVINSIIWKGTFSRLSVRPEEGMEVVCEGRMSTYPGRSNYQLIIEKLELAGAGALMALFEKRKAMFREEGLFDAERKQDLPFLPKTIGVVTSPTGAVIRDILHRIADRFPTHVLVWPVLVQGEQAAQQIAAAITGFNHADGFPRPDVLIVARGGGSLEDLWCFNEESVVRAASASQIPLISAVGHETDWTLIDFVADYRAPTPTGAAEIAVPVRADYLETLSDYANRLTRSQRRGLSQSESSLRALRLPRLENLLAPNRQRLDMSSIGLTAFDRRLESLAQHLSALQARMPGLRRLFDSFKNRYIVANTRLTPELMARHMREPRDKLSYVSQSLSRSANTLNDKRRQKLDQASALLEAYSYQGVLSRGYALVQTPDGNVIRSSEALGEDDSVNLVFADGQRHARITKAVNKVSVTGQAKPPNRKKTASQPQGKSHSKPDQGRLF